MKISAFQAILWTFGAYFSLAVAFVLAVTVSPGVKDDPVPQAAVQSAVFLTLCALFAGKRPGRSWSETFAIRRTSVWLVVLSLLLGIAVVLPANALVEVMNGLSPMDKDTEEALGRWSLARLPAGRGIALLVFAALIAPFAEELLFRGALYTGLRPIQTPVGAGWTTAVLFTLTHLEPRFWPSILLVAVFMAFVRAISGSLWPSVFLHVAFNATGLIKPLTPPPFKDPGLALVLGCLPVSAAIVGAIVWIGRRSASAERARRVDLEPDPGIGETDP